MPCRVLPQQVCTRLSASPQTFVTLSTHQPESVRGGICCARSSSAMHELRTLRGGLMDAGIARNRVSEGNEGTVGNVENSTVMRTDEVAEERDLVGVYLHEISRTPLLDAAREVDLSKAIEAGLYAEHLLESGEVRRGVSREELERLVLEGERGNDPLIPGKPPPLLSIAPPDGRPRMPLVHPRLG